MRLDVCIHEAGHAVVAWQVLGQVPLYVLAHPGPPLHAVTAVDFPDPRTTAEARCWAAFLAAGRAAVCEGRARGAICASVGERDGYGDAVLGQGDAGKIHALSVRHGLGLLLEEEAGAAARAVVGEHWPAVLRVAERLAGGLPLHRDYLDLILHGTPR